MDTAVIEEAACALIENIIRDKNIQYIYEFGFYEARLYKALYEDNGEMINHIRNNHTDGN